MKDNSHGETKVEAGETKVDNRDKRSLLAQGDQSLKKKRRTNLKKSGQDDGKPKKVLRRDERRELMAKAKQKWEQLRPKSTSKDKSLMLVQDLLDMLKGRIAEFVFRHDGSRIVQWMLGAGDEKHKAAVMKELMEGAEEQTAVGANPFFVRLACDRFGSHLAFKILRTASKKDKQVIFGKYLRGNVSELMRSKSGADVLDFAYQTTLNAKSKAELSVELLYSKERKLYEAVRKRLFEERRDGAAGWGGRNLFAESLDLLEDSFRDVAVESGSALINQLVDKEELLRFEIVHAAVKDYFDVTMKRYAKERAQELAELLAPSIVHFAHTKRGVHVAVTCVKLLDAKHRKKLVRGLKTHIRKLLEDEFGHRLIISLFEWVDDTRLVGGMVKTEMFSGSRLDAELNDGGEVQKRRPRGGRSRAEKKGKTQAGKSNEKRGGEGEGEGEGESEDGEEIDVGYMKGLCMHKYGRMVLMNLLVGRDSRYFNPDMYGFVWEGIDSDKFGVTSKKDATVRRQELVDALAEGMRRVMRGEMKDLLMNHWSAAVVIGALLSESTSDSVIDGVVRCLAREESVREMVTDTCARKTLGTVFKLGGTKASCAVLDGCATEVVRTLVSADGCAAIGTHLANNSGRSDVARLLRLS